MKRSDGRTEKEMREVKVTRGFMPHAEGSCLIEIGSTRVICTASVEDKVPLFLRDSGRGWITAEYGMLPRSCASRIPRPGSTGKVSGRTHEIQRLIGRSLRAVVDLSQLGERTVWIDCDVIQADGGTRTAGITGSFIALVDALFRLQQEEKITVFPVRHHVAATSVGIIGQTPVLDLNYEEDSAAEVDMNVVMTSAGGFVELQGTAEQEPFAQAQLESLLALARTGITALIRIQKEQLPHIPFVIQ